MPNQVRDALGDCRWTLRVRCLRLARSSRLRVGNDHQTDAPWLENTVEVRLSLHRTRRVGRSGDRATLQSASHTLPSLSLQLHVDSGFKSDL